MGIRLYMFLCVKGKDVSGDSLMDLGRFVIACALLTAVVLIFSLIFFEPYVTVVLTGMFGGLTLIAAVMELKGWDKKR